MTKIKLLAETDKTVTLRRVDFQALLDAAENNADLAAVEKHRAEEKRLGLDIAKHSYLTSDETERLLDGKNPVRVWREKRGMTQRALAEAAQVSVSYLAEIEGGKKPGSRDALQRLAQVLEIPMENLMESPEPSLQPVTRAEKAANRLAVLAEKTDDRARIADEARRIVREWLDIADADGAHHQVKASVGALESAVEKMASSQRREAIRYEAARNSSAAEQRERVFQALNAASNTLRAEYRKL
jgi:transcriptional regulator with XRE-family HTH domain